MDELGRNRETLNRVRSNVGVVSSTMDEARRIIRSECLAGWLQVAAATPNPTAMNCAAGMTKRELRTRICVAFFALHLLGMIIGLIVYFTQKKKENGGQ